MQRAAAQVRSRPSRRRVEPLPNRALQLVAESRAMGVKARLAAGQAAAYLLREMKLPSRRVAKILGVEAREVSVLIEELGDFIVAHDAQDALREYALKGGTTHEEMARRLGIS